MKNIESFFITAEAEVKSQIFVISFSLIMSLLSPMGLWLLNDTLYKSDKLKLVHIQMASIAGIIASLLILGVCGTVALRSIQFWSRYAKRFSEEENYLSNISSQRVDYVYPSFFRKSLIIQFSLVVYAWFVSVMLFSLSLLLPLFAKVAL